MENKVQNHQHKTSGKVFTEAYNPNRIERLKSIIRDFSNQGRKKHYAILVDGEMIVSRNADVRNFDNYKRYLEGHTQSIEVRMYFGESRNCNRHIFQTSHASLSGINQQDVQEQIKAALEKQSIQHELETLRKEVKRKNKKIEQYEAIIDELEAENDSKQLNIKELLQQGIALYGQHKTGQVPSTPIQGTPQAEVKVEVETETQADIQFKKMKGQYSEKELMTALKTWRVFTNHPELQNEFLQLINTKKQDHGKS